MPSNIIDVKYPQNKPSVHQGKEKQDEIRHVAAKCTSFFYMYIRITLYSKMGFTGVYIFYFCSKTPTVGTQ